MRLRQGFRPRGFEPHSPKAVLPEKYPLPITTDRVSYAGEIDDGGQSQRTERLPVENRSLRHPAGFQLCGKSAWCEPKEIG